MSDGMRIGELAGRSGVSARSLRYYEAQGLLCPARTANGYRRYDEEQLATVDTIRLLLDAGLTTEAVRGLLPCWEGSLSRGACPELLERLDRHLAEADRRLACQTRTRDLLASLRERVTERAAA